MRWLHAVAGATRTVKRFLFLPSRLPRKSDGIWEWRWLESARMIREYRWVGSEGNETLIWITSYWEDSDET